MIVIGEKEIGFVVVQYANGVDIEDCQEIELKRGVGEDGLAVLIEQGNVNFSGDFKAKL